MNMLMGGNPLKQEMGSLSSMFDSAVASAGGVVAGRTPHTFKEMTFTKPTYCSVCGELLVGLYKQGENCTRCSSFPVHKSCKALYARNPRHCHATKTKQKRLGRSGEITPAPEDVTGTRHNFVVHTYKQPTICLICRTLLKGAVNQGLQCDRCKYAACSKCADAVPFECEPRDDDDGGGGGDTDGDDSSGSRARRGGRAKRLKKSKSTSDLPDQSGGGGGGGGGAASSSSATARSMKKSETQLNLTGGDNDDASHDDDSYDGGGGSRISSSSGSGGGGGVDDDDPWGATTGKKASKAAKMASATRDVDEHQFATVTFTSPTYCTVCGGMIMGMYKQGQNCTTCKSYPIHERCKYIYQRFPKHCTGVKTKLKRLQKDGSYFCQEHDVTGNAHAFELTTFTQPTQCLLCRSLLKGAVNQGYACKICTFPVCTRCKDDAPLECEGDAVVGRHTMVIFSFTKPTNCKNCSKFLKGAVKQGYRCRDCKFPSCAACVNVLPNTCSESTAKGEKVGKLTLEVVACRDLAAGAKQPDPFVEVSFEGSKKRTDHKMQEANPTFKSKMAFDVTNTESLIEVVVYNYEGGAKPSMRGKCTIDCGELRDRLSDLDDWLTLTDLKGSTTKRLGAVHIKARLQTDAETAEIDPNVKADLSYKVVLVGDSAVGKSCIFTRYTKRTYQENIALTIQADFGHKLLQRGKKTVDVQLWDTAGQEKYKAMSKSFLRDAKGAMVCFDLTRRETFENIADRWIDYVRGAGADPNVVCVLVGNKVDVDARAVSRAEATQFAKTHHMVYMETSAKTAANVMEAFDAVVDEIHRTQRRIDNDKQQLSGGSKPIDIHKPAGGRTGAQASANQEQGFCAGVCAGVMGNDDEEQEQQQQQQQQHASNSKRGGGGSRRRNR